MSEEEGGQGTMHSPNIQRQWGGSPIEPNGIYLGVNGCLEGPMCVS